MRSIFMLMGMLFCPFYFLTQTASKITDKTKVIVRFPVSNWTYCDAMVGGDYFFGNNSVFLDIGFTASECFRYSMFELPYKYDNYNPDGGFGPAGFFTTVGITDVFGLALNAGYKRYKEVDPRGWYAFAGLDVGYKGVKSFCDTIVNRSGHSEAPSLRKQKDFALRLGAVKIYKILYFEGSLNLNYSIRHLDYYSENQTTEYFERHLETKYAVVPSMSLVFGLNFSYITKKRKKRMDAYKNV